ncbi:MAG: hypothetical protein D6757_11040 [Alphaproteobacteria bacterium]|nr:MAG: hypothetical protein D6757_11040 [Alphaproteobacteria bacterium]
MWPLHGPERRLARIAFRGQEAWIEARIVGARSVVGGDRAYWIAHASVIGSSSDAPAKGYGCAGRMIAACEGAIRECAERWLVRRLGWAARRPLLVRLRNIDRSLAVGSAADARLADCRARHDLLDKLMLARWRANAGDGRHPLRIIKRSAGWRTPPAFSVLLRDADGCWGAGTHPCLRRAEAHARGEILIQQVFGERDPPLVNRTLAGILVPQALAVVRQARARHLRWRCDGQERILAVLS